MIIDHQHYITQGLNDDDMPGPFDQVVESPDYRVLVRSRTWKPCLFYDTYGEGRGLINAGNASQITDGAAALILASERAARERRLPVLGWVRSVEFAALAPARMGLGPVHAAPRALDRAGVEMRSIGLVEINEAFAAIVLANLKAFASDAFAREELGRSRALGAVDPDRLNVNGGAIALGHPVGASGARLVLTLLHEMKRRDVELGLASLCIGGGQGAAAVLERA